MGCSHRRRRPTSPRLRTRACPTTPLCLLPRRPRGSRSTSPSIPPTPRSTAPTAHHPHRRALPTDSIARAMPHAPARHPRLSTVMDRPPSATAPPAACGFAAWPSWCASAVAVHGSSACKCSSMQVLTTASHPSPQVRDAGGQRLRLVHSLAPRARAQFGAVWYHRKLPVRRGFEVRFTVQFQRPPCKCSSMQVLTTAPRPSHRCASPSSSNGRQPARCCLGRRPTTERCACASLIASGCR